MMLALALAIIQAAPVTPSLYDRAVEERRAAHPGKAIHLLEELLRTEPNNSDAWVQLGFARREVGDAGGARSAFERALDLAPNYQDARDGLDALRRDRGLPYSISLDASHTAVSTAPDWFVLRLGLGAAISSQASISALIEESHRFGSEDTYLEGRFDGRLGEGRRYYLAVGGTPSADFRPVWQVNAGFTQRVSEGADPFLLTMDGGTAKYGTGPVSALSPGVQKYFGDGRAWLTAQWINIFSDGRRESGGLGRIDAIATDEVRVFGGFARAPDLSEGRVIQTTSYFGGASVALSNRVSWRTSVARDEPSTGSKRLTLSTGLDLRFK